MKISRITAYPLRCELQEPFSYSQKWFTHRTALLIRISTDEGIEGWGEAFCHDAGPAIATLIERTFQPLLLDKNPLDIAIIWDLLYNWTKDYGQKGITAAAISGVDIALWDILGKTTGMPVHQLLGGAFRKKVIGYATGMYRTQVDDVASALADEAIRYIERGFSAVKMKVGFGIDTDVQYVRSVRKAVGDTVDLMIDANHAYDASSAIKLGRLLEDQDITWFEEPVSPEDLGGYRKVQAALQIPVAGGEAEFTRYGFRPLIEGRVVDIVQPDICICGGISEGKVIADMARTGHIRCLPHAWGTVVGLAASLHFIASLPATPPSLTLAPMMIELDQTENPIRDIGLTSIDCAGGDVYIPEGPGLGIEIDMDRLERYLYK